VVEPGDDPSASLTKGSTRRLRIITESISLNPVGGIELCTFQDSIALAERGHSILLFYGEDGVLRPRFEAATIRLQGPENFEFNVCRPFPGLRRAAGPARRARSTKPDVLWLTRFEHIYWAYVVAKWSGCKIVCQLHHMPFTPRLSALHRGVAHFVAVSHFLRDEWIKMGIDPDRITVVENALPPGTYPRGGRVERDEARRALGLSPDVTIVLYYGRMMREKGIGTLLEAWAQVGLSPQEAQLVLVGSPSPWEKPEFAEQLSRVEPATLHWYPLQEDVVPFLHAADLVVFPTWLEEGFGRVIAEGLSTGRPVIAARVGAVPEVLSGPMSRFLVEPKNPDDLAARIKALLNWRQDEPGLEEDCAAWIEERYPYDRHLAQLEELLTTYANAPKRRVRTRASEGLN
jgi:glycosyltransferase involved in cell wall biosynthesis